MCSTILAAPDETLTRKINETILNSTNVNRSTNSSVLDGITGPYGAKKSTENLIEKIDMASLRRAGLFLAEPKCWIFLSGFNEHQQEQLRRCLKSAGALVMNQLTSSVTHVIINHTLPLEHIKTIGRLKLNPYCVSVQWLVESMQMGMAVPESDFLISSPAMQSLIEPPKGNPSLVSTIGPLPNSENQFNEVSTRKPMDVSTVTNEDDIEDDIMAQYRNATATAVLLKPSEKIKTQKLEDDDSGDVTISFKMPINTKQCTEVEKKPFEKNTEASYRCNIATEKSCSLKSNELDSDTDTDKHQPTEETGIQTLTEDADTQYERYLVGKKLALIGFDEESNAELSKLVQEAGGDIVHNNLNGILDYLIVPVTSDALLYSNSRAKNVVSNYWLEDCLEQGEELEIEYYHKPINFGKGHKPCGGIVIGITGYTGRERVFIVAVAEALGMVAQEVFAKREKGRALRSTHLICANPEGAKYEAGVKWDLPVVNKDWILACLRDANWVSERPFLVGDASKTTAGKPNPKAQPTNGNKENSLLSNATASRIFDENVNTNKAPTTLENFDSPISSRSSVVTAYETPIVTTVDEEKIRHKPVALALTPLSDGTFSRMPLESQPSPAVLKRKREDENKHTTPFILRNIKTPETPYGAFLGKNPSKDTRKFWKLQCDELGRFEYTAEERAELAAKKERIAQYAKQRQDEREKMNMDKEYEEYFKHALDPERTKQMHVNTFKKCGVPILEPGGKTFDELMEEKMQKQGKSWKNPKRFRLASQDSSSLAECNREHVIRNKVSSPNIDTSKHSAAAAELSEQLAKFEALAQMNKSNTEEIKDTLVSSERNANSFNKQSTSKRRSSMKMTLCSVETEPERNVDIGYAMKKDEDSAMKSNTIEPDFQIRWVNPKEVEERKRLSARLSRETQDIAIEENEEKQQVLKAIFNCIRN